jgi:queuine/archaeosine tRNA-ribosyltransferase
MDNKSSSFKQILAEMARRREARRARREARLASEAIQMDTQHPQQEKWCYTCRRNVTTPVNHLAQWHHVAGMTMLNAHQCPGNDATSCGKSGTHMGQLTS